MPLPVSAVAVVCLVNDIRAWYGLPPLVDDQRLDLSAQDNSEYMVQHSVYDHVAFTLRLTYVRYNWQDAGENIDTGPSTPIGVVWAWMMSREHCQNILDPTYRNVGTGVTEGTVAPYGGAATWTQDYGLMVGQAPASTDARAMQGCGSPPW